MLHLSAEENTGFVSEGCQNRQHFLYRNERGRGRINAWDDLLREQQFLQVLNSSWIILALVLFSVMVKKDCKNSDKSTEYKVILPERIKKCTMNLLGYYP